jgi:hypothetical protein
MPRSLVDGNSSGYWTKQAGVVAQAAAALNTSPGIAANVTSQSSGVQEVARAVAASPGIRRGTRNRSRRIIW